METFYDIYQNYLQNPYGEINALSQVNPSPGIMNTNTISPTGGDSMGVSPVASINTNPNVTNTAPGTGIMGTNITNIGTEELIQDYMNATQNRTNRLANPNMIQDLFNRYTGGGQRTYDQMIGSGQGDIRSSGIPFGIGSLLSRALPDRYYDMSLGDQAFTQSQMGYTGPTVFGQNTGNQDPFGMNVRSAFGNYGEAVQKNFDSLNSSLSDRLAQKYGVTFDPNRGIYLGENADIANRQTQMMRDQFNFRKDQLVKRADIDSRSKDAIANKEKTAEIIRDNKQYFSGPKAKEGAFSPKTSRGRKDYGLGGRVGYAEGSVSQEGRMSYLYPGLLDGSFNPKNFEEDRALDYSFNQFKPLQFIGASGYPETTYGDEPINLDQLKEFKKQLDQLQLQRGDVPKRYFDKLDQAINIASQATTPTEDFSDYVTKTAPTVAEQIISTNNLSPFSSAPLTTSMAEKLFPQGDFLNIKETATSPTEYNIEATKDLVENLPGGIVKDIVAPTAAFALSLPYDAIQAYQRMEPGSGIQGFGKAFQAERPLESAFERFTGAAGPLAENINTAISSLNPFQKQQYMNYAVQNPEQAIAAAQQNKDFLAATQKNTNPATSCSCFNGRWWKSFLFTRWTS
jgi:hypothetical protein